MRDNYKRELCKVVNKYGIVNMPISVQRTMPTDLKVLYELPWYVHPTVWRRILQIAWKNAHNEIVRRALHV